MARNIRTKKVNALKSVSNISSGDEFIVSTSEQNEDGSTTTAVKKVSQNVLEAKIVDAAVAAIGEVGGGGGGAAVTENTIAVNTFSSNTYARSTNFVFNKNGKVLETEVMNIANPCTVTVCVNITTNGVTNNSYAVLKVKTPNMHEWMDVENIPINISATSSVNYSFSNMKIFSGVSLKVVVYDTKNTMLISGSSVNLNEFKNDGDFTDHGETFIYLVNSGDHLSDTEIKIPDINGTNNGVIRTRGYVSVINCWSPNSYNNVENNANYNITKSFDRSVNFYLQIKDDSKGLWKTLDVVSLYVNLTASTLHNIEFNDVFVPNGAKLRILTSYNYPTVYNIGPYTKNNFIIKFESMLDADVNNLPSNLISFNASNAYITTNGIEYDGTYVSFNTKSGRSPSPIRGVELSKNESAPHNFTSLLPICTTIDYMTFFSPTFVGIRQITPFNNLVKRDAGYFAQINYENSAGVNGSTVLWGDQDGELSFTMTDAEKGYFYGDYHVVLSNDVKSIGFSCRRAITQDNGSASYNFVNGSYSQMSTENAEDSYRPYIQNLISVDKIGSKVETLEEFCFTGASNLTRVNFPKDRKINFKGYYSFYGCTSLNSLDIPDNVNMDIPNVSNEGFICDCIHLKDFKPPKNFVFATRTISGCDELASLTLTSLDSNRHLPKYAIAECPNLSVFDLRKFSTFESSGIVNCGSIFTNVEGINNDLSKVILDYSTIANASDSTTENPKYTFPRHMIFTSTSLTAGAGAITSVDFYNTHLSESQMQDYDTAESVLKYKIKNSLLKFALPLGHNGKYSRTCSFYVDEGKTLLRVQDSPMRFPINTMTSNNDIDASIE